MARSRAIKPSSDADQFPHSASRSKTQIDGLLRYLGANPKRILDLGCGSGRVLAPLVEAGHDVTGVDCNAAALRACRLRLRTLRLKTKLIRADFVRAIPVQGAFDAALCLGNTLMTITSVDHAVKLLHNCARLLKPNGAMFIDDFPHELWPELTEGRWQSGLSRDHQMQMIWSRGDNVFAIRQGKHVDPTAWQIHPGDRCFRLWTMGELSLAARLAGLSAPAWKEGASLIVLARRRGSRTGVSLDIK